MSHIGPAPYVIPKGSVNMHVDESRQQGNVLKIDDCRSCWNCGGLTAEIVSLDITTHPQRVIDHD
jgi:hypothetical protein